MRAWVLASARALRLRCVQLVLKAAHLEPAPLLKTQWHSYHLKAPHLTEVVRDAAGKAPLHPFPSLLCCSAQ